MLVTGLFPAEVTFFSSPCLCLESLPAFSVYEPRNSVFRYDSRASGGGGPRQFPETSPCNQRSSGTARDSLRRRAACSRRSLCGSRGERGRTPRVPSHEPHFLAAHEQIASPRYAAVFFIYKVGPITGLNTLRVLLLLFY